ncbi:hypothetical protein K0M31_000817 [Melipona bicolor]|uniref:Uncharacterized protein n=1 Tax=Melipona bicolor TaxID=60889 RepID=A0AA40GEJ2_9HYME|nr:hypothetical protein K0M31_000817 [Melipona bicolor]
MAKWPVGQQAEKGKVEPSGNARDAVPSIDDREHKLNQRTSRVHESLHRLAVPRRDGLDRFVPKFDSPDRMPTPLLDGYHNWCRGQCGALRIAIHRIR